MKRRASSWIFIEANLITASIAAVILSLYALETQSLSVPSNSSLTTAILTAFTMYPTAICGWYVGTNRYWIDSSRHAGLYYMGKTLINKSVVAGILLVGVLLASGFFLLKSADPLNRLWSLPLFIALLGLFACWCWLDYRRCKDASAVWEQHSESGGGHFRPTAFAALGLILKVTSASILVLTIGGYTLSDTAGSTAFGWICLVSGGVLMILLWKICARAVIWMRIPNTG